MEWQLQKSRVEAGEDDGRFAGLDTEYYSLTEVE
jgi:hypothetical protein